jgi:hypothetical protein
MGHLCLEKATEIRSLTLKETWRYVTSAMNPADVPSLVSHTPQDNHL